jgi:hypothetical protein
MIDPFRTPLRKGAAGEPLGRSGGVFYVRAVGAGPGGLWTFSYEGGKTLTAKTALPLVPGVFYKGVFIQKSGGLEFVPQGKFSGEGSPVFAAPSRPLLAGTPEFARFILTRAFFHAGVPLPQGGAYEEILRFVTRRAGREVLARSALAARCEAKGLCLAAEAYESLYAVFEGCSGGGRENGGGKEKKDKAEEAPVSEAPAGETEGGEGDLLLLFNHLCEGEETWTVYPYRCMADGLPYTGSLRVLYSRGEKTAKKHVLFVRAEEDAWHFAWDAGRRLKIYYTGGLDRQNLLPGAWKRKFGKLGLYSDDIIYNGENFDGFSGETEEERGIDRMV